jgi:hypothetical protein
LLDGAPMLSGTISVAIALSNEKLHPEPPDAAMFYVVFEGGFEMMRRPVPPAQRFQLGAGVRVEIVCRIEGPGSMRSPIGRIADIVPAPGGRFARTGDGNAVLFCGGTACWRIEPLADFVDSDGMVGVGFHGGDNGPLDPARSSAHLNDFHL